MANVRVTTSGYISRTPGDITGVQLNTFGLSKLEAGMTGDILADIAVDAMQPALEYALQEWPVLTGASRDTIEVAVLEVSERSVRVALKVGGERLIADPRNERHKDYAPFVEFNGSPAGRGQGTIFHALYAHRQEIRDRLHAGVALAITEMLQ